MRHAAISIIALFVLLTGAAPSALANGTDAAGGHTLSLESMQTTLFPGDTLAGTVTLTTAPGLRRVQVNWQVFIETPVGDTTVQSGSFRMNAGRTRSFPLELPIEETAAPGLYRIKLLVTIDGAELSVGHEFTVEKGA